MPTNSQRAIAIVGVGAVLPDAPDAPTFWENLIQARYSISDVDPERWDPELYFDDDKQAVGKTYSKIGGWVKEYDWDPLGWRLPIPPKVSDAMDRTQQWAINAAREALVDYGYPDRPIDNDRTAVIIGNAMGGDRHYITALPIYFPEFAAELDKTPAFAGLPAETKETIHDQYRSGVRDRFPTVTEDTMPGELANIIAGRIANVFNLHGPNFIADAACASAMAAIDAAIEGLEEGDYDAVITGGVDANMSASTFVKFCKIGALSATGTRPYGNGADGFIMGEGAALFVLKRLADAEAAGDQIYAVIRGLAGASDGKGKGITAPNPVGQRLAIERAWNNAGIAPNGATYIEGHGTSTKVGDVVEFGSITDAFADLHLPAGSIPLGSVKSNIGHLKGAAGAAGILKTALALHHKTLPPSLGAEEPNPNIEFDGSPLAVNTRLRDWQADDGAVRSAGVSAFGFGGTNFHAVLEEYVPGRITAADDRPMVSVSEPATATREPAPKAPLRGVVVIGDVDDAAVLARLQGVRDQAAKGVAPAPTPPVEADLRAPVRVAIDFGDADELAARAAKACAALETDNAGAWKLLRNQGVFLGRGPAHQVAFLYTGQGSQYVNMLAELRGAEPIVARGFDEADAVMEPILGRPLTDVIFVDPSDEQAVAAADEQLRQTEITQPAVLTVDRALTEILGAYGIHADMVMGHSLGEYGALVAAGALPFEHALEAVAARGREMVNVSVDDNGLMAAVFAPLEEIEQTIDATDGYVVVANNNSAQQAVIGGASPAVQAAVDALQAAGHMAVMLPVSHAFHTEIVAPAAGPLKEVLGRLDIETPHVPVVANVDGEFYPMGPAVAPEMIEILGRQVASPVQFIKGLETLYQAGARVFVEVGPKRALHGFVDDVLGDHDDVVNLFTNHPKSGDIVSFNQALCGLYAAGHGVGTRPEPAPEPPAAAATRAATRPAPVTAAPRPQRVTELGELFAEFLERGYDIYAGGAPAAGEGLSTDEPVVVTGAALGLPGTQEVFDDLNIERLLDGESFIDVIPVELRNAIVDKHITRLVKNEAGGGSFEEIDSAHDVMKLAGRKGHFDIVEQFAIPEDRKLALDPATELAIGAGIDALRDAGIPMVMRYKTTSTGSKLPEGWALPSSLSDGTGVIFASAFPGVDRLVDEVSRYESDRGRRDRLHALEHLRERMDDGNPVVTELDHMIHEQRADIEAHKYEFDRRFLFKALSMGHAQFAEHIRARGPNTQINSACASTTQAVALAEDWIRLGRCNRVVIIAGDDVTSDTLIEWVGAGFLSTGAAATDEVVEDAALPFDKRRHGMLLGMGGAAIVVESAASARERGLRPICDVLSTTTANSAFHGSRLDVNHIREVMERLVAKAETRWGINRHEIAPATVFVSHETYTPARGGSAQAEVDALRYVFGASADQVVVANTKGFTGHAMGVGIEDVLAVKALETGIVPPIANVKEVDPDLGHLNLSKGGAYPVTYALRLGAGFGSQISMSLLRWTPSADGARREPDELGFEYRIADAATWAGWLRSVSGYEAPGIEVDHRVLRVRDDGPPAGVTSAPLPTVATAPPVVAGPTPAAMPAPAAAPAPPPAAVAAPEPAVEPVPVPEPAGDPVAGVVLGIVAEQTGYPSDMLDLDLDLEADLGIDTVKQAETFAAIREHYDIERDDNLSLRDYPTLASVIGFVRDRATGLEPAPTTLTTAAAPAAPAAAAAAPAAPAGDPVADVVLGIVAEQTGYPSDMLDLDLDLEADLGIDTVKQAETFAAIREHYDIERDDNLSLRDYPTLASVIGFVRERATGLEPAPTTLTTAAAPAAPAAAAAAPAAPAGDPVADVVLGIVAEQTGYPSDMLDLDLDLEADLGIDTVKQAETFAAIREHYDIERDDNLSLRDYPTLASVIGFVHERATNLPEPAAASAAASAPAAAPGAAPTAPAGDGVEAVVLGIVADQTGYPSDMLDLDLDLEADLGIDTVKQAETFAAIREHYDIERDDNLSLRDYPTLASVIGFVHERATNLPTAPVSKTTAPATEPAGDDGVEAVVLGIVADQTGYPSDMLDLDLDLEADLGIDTVKQAETFAAIREHYAIERDDNLSLRDYPTLASVIGFVHERATNLGGARASATETTPTPTVALREAVAGDDEAAAAIARRSPTPVLRPGLPSCLTTGVDLDADARVVVMLDEGGVGAALVDRLRSREVDVLAIDGAPDADELLEQIDTWRGDRSVSGIYWLPALDIEPTIDDLDLDGWREGLRHRVKLLYRTLRHLYEQVGSEGGFLVSGTRLGGLHGYGPEGATAPMGGGVVGITKAFKRERPDAIVKAVDFAASRKTAGLADILIDETLRDPGVIEVGHHDGHRYTLTLRAHEIPDPPTGLELGPDSVFVITGAAGSIVSAIIADLGRATGGTFHLLDLVPEPDANDPDIIAFDTDRDALKRTLFERLGEGGQKVTPVMVERELAKLERSHEALAAIQSVTAAGGTVHYHAVNLLDPEAMGTVTDSIVATSGRVDALIHAGGLEISRLMPDKEPSEYDLVFDVKADGWFNLLHGLGSIPIGATVAFSSIAGRFGNGGQTDYSAANDLLCKFTSNMKTVRPDTIGFAVDWTAWGDIGMATRGSIPTVMAAAGIDMLPAAAGIPIVRRELTGDGNTREMVAAQRLGMLSDELHPTGGLDVASFDAALTARPLLTEVVGVTVDEGLVVNTTLDPTAQPFLDDHRIDGTAVLPGVMGMELFAQVASLPFDDRHVTAIEAVDFAAPVKFYRDEPRTLRVTAQYGVDGDDLVADCQIVGERLLANRDEPQRTVHFTGRVRLGNDAVTAETIECPAVGDVQASSDEIYEIYFHGPAYQVMTAAWRSNGSVVGERAREVPANQRPADAHLFTAPRLTELCFQTAGVFEIGTTGQMALPMHLDRVVPVAGNEPEGQTHAIVRPLEDGRFEADVIDEAGRAVLRLEGYQTVPLPGALGDGQVAPLRAAMTDQG